MKIDPTIKRGDLSQAFKEHLGFVYVMDVKSSVVVFLLVLFDLPLLMGLLSIFKIEFLWILMPAIAIMHLWGIRLLILNPYSTQFEMIRFIGVLGILGSLSCFILALGMTYFVLKISSVIFYIIITLSIFVSTYILIKYQIHRYSREPTMEQKKSDQSKYYGLVSAAPGIGYSLAQSTKDSEVSVFIMTLIIYLAVIFYVYLAAKFIHRYFFMKINIDYVKFQPISKKQKKKLSKQGVMIK